MPALRARGIVGVTNAVRRVVQESDAARRKIVEVGHASGMRSDLRAGIFDALLGALGDAESYVFLAAAHSLAAIADADPHWVVRSSPSYTKRSTFPRCQ